MNIQNNEGENFEIFYDGERNYFAVDISSNIENDGYVCFAEVYHDDSYDLIEGFWSAFPVKYSDFVKYDYLPVKDVSEIPELILNKINELINQ